MNTVTAALVAATGVVLLILLSPLLVPLVGAFAGFVVGGFFPETFRAFLDGIGMEALAPWQFGFMTAFVGVWFRPRSQVAKG